MTPSDLSRRTFLRVGSGMIAAVAFGGCTSTRTGGQPPASPSPSTSSAAPPAPTTGAPPATAPQPGAPAGATRFRPMQPTRVTDTRRPGGWTQVSAGRLRVAIAGRAGVPAEATAAAVRVAGIRAGASGAGLTVVPAGTQEEVPAPAPGPAPTATCLVLLGGGAIDVLHDGDTADVTVDVLGWFEPATSAVAGRIVTIEPTRVADTAAAARPFAASETRRIVPRGAWPPDATAVLLQLTATSEAADGAWTLGPSVRDGDPPTLVAGARGAATATDVVALSDGGFDVASLVGGHLTVDVVGYVTGDEAGTSTDGLYVPVPPRRLLDTRGVQQPIPDGSSREVGIGVDRCAGVAVNVTAVAVTGGGVTTAWGAGHAPTPSARLPHGEAGSVTSGHLVVPTGRRGVALGSSGGAGHVVADLYGWFTGQPSPGNEPVLGSQPYGIHAVDMEAHADEWLDYGFSTDGRPLRAFRHGDGPRVGVITTGLHGDEHTGTSIVADLVTREPIPGWTLWLIPIANPDARAADARYVHEVDMNRDFPVDWRHLPGPTGSGCVTTRTGPAPLSLVESTRLAEAMTVGPFRRSTISISHHDNYNWVAPQSGSPPVLRELADEYAVATGLRRPGEGGSIVPTSPRFTHVDGGFETFAASLGMASFLVENKAGYVGGAVCAGTFGVRPSPGHVEPHHDALRALLTDGRLPTG